MKKIFSTTFFPLLLLLVSSCGKHETEREQYDEARSSIKYKTYKAVTEKMKKEMVTIDGVKKENEFYMHLLLAYNWAMTGQDVFAFAESDFVNGHSNRASEKVLCHSINSIVMYNNGWKKLSQDEFSELKDAIHKDPGDDTFKFHNAVFNLVMGTFSMQEKDFDAARFHYTNFGQATHIYWPSQLADAVSDLQHNRETGLNKLRAMTENTAVPAEVRLILSDNLAKVDTKKASAEPSLFWPRSVSIALLGQLKKSEVKEIQMAAMRFEKLRQKLMI